MLYQTILIYKKKIIVFLSRHLRIQENCIKDKITAITLRRFFRKLL